MTTKPDWEGAQAYVLGRLETELPPGLPYHGIHHTRDDVLPTAEKLAALSNLDADDTFLLRTGALYHDIGFVEQYQVNEPIAVRIASETLPGFGYTRDQIQVIQGIILATQLPQTPSTFLQELMCDADLDSLGRDDFFVTSMNLRQELEAHGIHPPIKEWYQDQIRFLSEHTYFTDAARSLRNAGKQRNLRELERYLRSVD